MFSFDGNVRWEETAIKEHGFPLRGNETSTTVTFTGAHRTGERACIPTRSLDVHPSRETLTHWRETGGQERDGFGSTSRASTMILVKREILSDRLFSKLALDRPPLSNFSHPRCLEKCSQYSYLGLHCSELRSFHTAI